MDGILAWLSSNHQRFNPSMGRMVVLKSIDGSTSVQLAGRTLCMQSPPAAIAATTNHCVLLSGKAPCWHKTIALLVRFPPSTMTVLMGESSDFLSCLPWLQKKKIASSMACLSLHKSRKVWEICSCVNKTSPGCQNDSRKLMVNEAGELQGRKVLSVLYTPKVESISSVCNP